MALLQEEQPCKRRALQVQYLWNMYVAPIGMRGLSIVSLLLSCLILWSELTMFLVDDDNLPLSIVSLLLEADGQSFLTLQMVVFVPLCYMAFVCYFALFRAKLFSFYEFVPSFSDQQTLLFNALFMSRFTLPICYNAMMVMCETIVLNDSGHQTMQRETGFSSVLGFMDVVPLLGEHFNLYYPIALVVFVVMSIFQWWGKLFACCRHHQSSSILYDVQESDEEVELGKSLIHAALEGRRLHGNDPLTFS